MTVGKEWLLEWFLDFLWNSQAVSIVIVAVLLTRLLIRKLPRQYSYLLWALVGLRMVCMAWFPSSFSLFHLLYVVSSAVLPGNAGQELFGGQGIGDWQGIGDIQGIGSGQGSGGWQGGGGVRGMEGWQGLEDGAALLSGLNQKETFLARMVSGLADGGVAGLSIFQNMVSALFLLWLLGLAAMLLYGLCSAWRCRRLVRQAVRLKENIWECDNLPSPFVWGILRPRVYLPFRLPEKERRYILEHEQYHIQRKDFLAKLLAFALLSVYWFHPLVWLSYTLFLQDLEISCDEAVLKRLGEGIKKDYSASILAFAAGKRKPALGLAFGESPSSKRIRHVLQYRQPKRGKGLIGIVVAVLLAALCLTDQPEAKATGEKEQSAGTSAEPSGEFYRLYPHIIDYMGMTYSEYQELTGQALQLVEKDFFSGGFCTGALPGTGAEVVLKGSYDVEKGEYEINEEAKFVRLQGKLSDFVSLPEGESLQMSLAELFIRLSSSEETEIRNLLDRENEYDIEAGFSMYFEVDWRGEEKRKAILTFAPEGGALLNQVDPEMRVWLSWTWETVR